MEHRAHALLNLMLLYANAIMDYVNHVEQAVIHAGVYDVVAVIASRVLIYVLNYNKLNYEC